MNTKITQGLALALVLTSTMATAVPGGRGQDVVIVERRTDVGKDVEISATVVPWSSVDEKDGVISVTPPAHGVRVESEGEERLLTKKEPVEISDVKKAKGTPNVGLSY